MDEERPPKKWSGRKGLCAHSPQKKKDGAGGACAKKEKRKKNIPGSSLIEAPDVAGVHQDKKKIRGERFIRAGRRRRKEGKKETKVVGR